MTNNYGDRVVDTRGLRALASDAARHNLNRVPELPENIDPDGYHLLSMVLFGHNMDSSPVLHHRCTVLIKVQGSLKPVEAMLDITDTAFTNLPSAEFVLKHADDE